MTEKNRITIVYDGDCPFCRDYSQRLRLIEAAGPLEMIDARSNHPTVIALWQQGYDLDQGMVALVNGATYFGSEAVIALAQMSSPNTTFNRINHALFSHPAFARALYPWLKLGRRLALLVRFKKGLRDPIRSDGSRHK